jgi:hypothetical protein
MEKNPAGIIAAHAYADPAAVKKSEDAELRALAAKLDAGTLSDADQKRAIRLLIKRQIGD